MVTRTIDLDHHVKLVRAVRAWNNPETLGPYLDAMAALLGSVGFDEDDPRLVTSTPKAVRDWSLPVTINNRYVLAARNRARREFVVILGAEPVEGGLLEEDAAVLHTWHFKALRHEMSVPPYLASFAQVRALERAPLRALWFEAARAEAARARRSAFRLHHNPAVYRAAVQRAYRSLVLDEAQAA